MLRTAARRTTGTAFEDVTLVSTSEGSRVRLGDIARVTDGFAEEDIGATYDGKPAVIVERVPRRRSDPERDRRHGQGLRQDQAAAARARARDLVRRERAYQQRVDLLTRNAILGLVLVLLILGLFLEIRLAFWVTLGIPISFLGSMLLPADIRGLDQHDLAVRLHPGARDGGRRRDRGRRGDLHQAAGGDGAGRGRDLRAQGGRGPGRVRDHHDDDAFTSRCSSSPARWGSSSTRCRSS